MFSHGPYCDIPLMRVDVELAVSLALHLLRLHVLGFLFLLLVLLLVFFALVFILLLVFPLIGQLLLPCLAVVKLENARCHPFLARALEGRFQHATVNCD